MPIHTSLLLPNLTAQSNTSRDPFQTLLFNTARSETGGWWGRAGNSLHEVIW